jgi:hypothetical protein
MARLPLATIEDLEERLNEAVGDALLQAEARLRDASAIVRAYAGETWLNDDGELEDVPDDIPGVVASMVERASRNPAGITQETAGPFARSFGSDASQRLYLTANEKLIIRNAIGARSAIGTLSTTRGDVETGWITEDYAYWPEEESIPWPSS